MIKCWVTDGLDSVSFYRKMGKKYQPHSPSPNPTGFTRRPMTTAGLLSEMSPLVLPTLMSTAVLTKQEGHSHKKSSLSCFPSSVSFSQVIEFPWLLAAVLGFAGGSFKAQGEMLGLRSCTSHVALTLAIKSHVSFLPQYQDQAHSISSFNSVTWVS